MKRVSEKPLQQNQRQAENNLSAERDTLQQNTYQQQKQIDRLSRECLHLERLLNQKRIELDSVYNTVAGKFILFYKATKKRWKQQHDQSRKALTTERETPTYIPIRIAGTLIQFHTKPLQDQRGIGRVSRELLEQLQDIERREKTSLTQQTVYFFPDMQSFPPTPPEPSVVLVHDVIPLLFPECFGSKAERWKTKLKERIQKATAIVTISHSSALDISRHLSLNRSTIRVIHNGITRLPVETQLRGHHPCQQKKFIVFIGSYDKHKNLDVIFHAMKSDAINDVECILIGDNRRAIKTVKSLQLQNRVHFMGTLNDKECAAVISDAFALVFPSLYEGFGMPPLEAALLGTPSICSSRPAMTEIMNDAALFASPHLTHEWVEAIQQLRDDRALSNHLVNQAQQRADSLTWQKSAAELLETLEQTAQ